jgi:hypothetical protein
MPYKLGKKPHRHDDRTLKFSKYLTAELPPIPDDYTWIAKDKISDWGMMANDQYGDCVWAALGHLIMSWGADNGKIITLTDADILNAYASTGFNPATGEGDNGTDELTALKYMQSTGIAGHKIGAFVSVDHTNILEIKQATYLFGGGLIGIELPLCMQNQNSWTLPPPDGNTQSTVAGSWGGHGIPNLSYHPNGVYVISWGQPMFSSWQANTAYVDEYWAILSPDFVNGTKPSPNGWNMDLLNEDLLVVQQQ